MEKRRISRGEEQGQEEKTEGRDRLPLTRNLRFAPIFKGGMTPGHANTEYPRSAFTFATTYAKAPVVKESYGEQWRNCPL